MLDPFQAFLLALVTVCHLEVMPAALLYEIILTVKITILIESM